MAYLRPWTSFGLISGHLFSIFLLGSFGLLLIGGLEGDMIMHSIRKHKHRFCIPWLSRPVPATSALWPEKHKYKQEFSKMHKAPITLAISPIL